MFFLGVGGTVNLMVGLVFTDGGVFAPARGGGGKARPPGNRLITYVKLYLGHM